MPPSKKKDAAAVVKEDSSVKKECLHCHSTTGGVQVSCDECRSFICNTCHWCHEFQANHEIRVCDRCDGFYCRSCDEMDQCEDCAEVVCGSCSSLLSCKFCGGGLCPDCATACGKCGIVLCARDSKFAVECDTCKLSYCLVCLASSHKDPCVRCGHRPSKRMEQLVHLRLKSIYKAFQQSNPKDKKERSGDKAAAAAAAAAAASTAASATASSSSCSSEKKPPPKAPEKPLRERQEEADAAAAALLAELDQEEEEMKKKSKKRKKKKKKEESNTMEEKQISSAKEEEEEPPEEEANVSVEEEDFLPKQEDTSVEDPAEAWLCELVSSGSVEGVEAFLAELRGVPGKAALRKNAKKALKRLKEEEAAAAAEASDVVAATAAATEQEPTTTTTTTTTAAATTTATSSYKPPEPLLTLVSRNVQGSAKSECVLHMSPSVVGWVIGKGGQRIRDLMEDSGSKVWIDQDSMGPHEARVVYVSGPGKSVDDAVRRIKELVAKAPVGGTTTATSVARRPSVTSSTVATKESPGRPARKEKKSSTSQDKDWAVQELTCESRFVPLLIGRRGWTIKHIQDSSGARVDIDQTVTPRCIRISGKKDCVATAVRMVQDVLSYPHAHLDHNGQHSNDDVVEVVEDSDHHSPPPSSYIMTHDNKSTISVSSSLSSTPEPSMASSGKGSYKHPGQLSAAAMIPPGGAPSYVQASSFGELAAREAPRTMGSGVTDAAQLFPMSGVAPLNEVQKPQASRPSSAGGGPSFAPQGFAQASQDVPFGQLGGMPGQHGGGGMPPYAQHQQQQQQQQQHLGSAHGQSQQQHGGPFGGSAPGGHPSYGQSQQQQPPYGNHQSLGTGGSLLHDSFLGGQQQQQQLHGGMRQDSIGRSQSMPQSRRPTYPTDSYQPANRLFQEPSREGLVDRGHVQSGNMNDAEAFLPNLWGRDNPPQTQSSEVNPGLYREVGLFHRQHSDNPVRTDFHSNQERLYLGRKNSAPEMHDALGPPGLSNRADSDMVDSLFGPSGGGGEQNLLSGFQSLGITNKAPGPAGWSSSVGGGAGWGDNQRSDMNSAVGQQQSNLGGALDVSHLSGGPLGGSQHHQQQQQNQPSQSRFDWG